MLIPQVSRWRYPMDCGGNGLFSYLHAAFTSPYKRSVARYRKRHPNCKKMGIARLRREAFIPWECKKYDISYMARVNSGPTRQMFGVNAHRDQAVQALRFLAARHPELSIFIHESTKHVNYRTYIDVLKESRVFLSPLGLGEFSGKDYEAMLAGAVLLDHIYTHISECARHSLHGQAKPGAARIQAYPNIYDGAYTVNVAMDFSDLEEKIMPFVGPKSKAAEGRVARSLQLLQRHSTMQQLADDLHKLLTEVTNRTVELDPRGCHPSAYW
eukprot:scaffold56491_cov39-Prasinocladus_malaysianus.AAC.1